MDAQKSAYLDRAANSLREPYKSEILKVYDINHLGGLFDEYRRLRDEGIKHSEAVTQTMSAFGTSPTNSGMVRAFLSYVKNTPMSATTPVES